MTTSPLYDEDKIRKDKKLERKISKIEKKIKA